jgi:dTDP-4-dehydrorhamnose 3,5-epimerase
MDAVTSQGPEDAVGGRKDEAHMSPEWVVDRRLIEGVFTREVRNVVTANGITTELFRADWDLEGVEVQQAIHVRLRGGALSAWHQHRERWDYIFVIGGHIRIVLHDPREDSPTHGQVDVFHLSPARPQLLGVPPWIWHGVQNLSTGESAFVNLFNRPYDYSDPDEWRLPPGTGEIPYEFD